MEYYYIYYNSKQRTELWKGVGDINQAYKKGVFELCILAVLYRGDCYGYDVSEKISRYMDISDGTAYPILRKLKAEGFLTTYLSEESGGPPRKYYSITKTGKELFLRERKEWLEFYGTVSGLILGEDDLDEQGTISK